MPKINIIDSPKSIQTHFHCIDNGAYGRITWDQPSPMVTDIDPIYDIRRMYAYWNDNLLSTTIRRHNFWSFDECVQWLETLPSIHPIYLQLAHDIIFVHTIDAAMIYTIENDSPICDGDLVALKNETGDKYRDWIGQNCIDKWRYEANGILFKNSQDGIAFRIMFAEDISPTSVPV